MNQGCAQGGSRRRGCPTFVGVRLLTCLVLGMRPLPFRRRCDLVRKRVMFDLRQMRFVLRPGGPICDDAYAEMPFSLLEACLKIS